MQFVGFISKQHNLGISEFLGKKNWKWEDDSPMR